VFLGLQKTQQELHLALLDLVGAVAVDKLRNGLKRGASFAEAQNLRDFEGVEHILIDEGSLQILVLCDTDAVQKQQFIQQQKNSFLHFLQTLLSVAPRFAHSSADRVPEQQIAGQFVVEVRF
jgi:hypothetical protein